MSRKNEKLPGINENYRLLRYEYAFRQVGFIALLAIILAAIGGLFSSGYFSDSTKTNGAASLTLRYERFGRRETESRMQLSVPVKGEEALRFSLTSESGEAYEPGSVWPQPDRMYSRGNTLYFVYNHPPAGDTFTLWFYLTPLKAGKWNNVVRVNSEPEIRFWQFIYP